MADRMDSRQQKTRFVKPKNCIDFLGSHLHCLGATLAKTQTSFYRTHDSSRTYLNASFPPEPLEYSKKI